MLYHHQMYMTLYMTLCHISIDFYNVMFPTINVHTKCHVPNYQCTYKTNIAADFLEVSMDTGTLTILLHLHSDKVFISTQTKYSSPLSQGQNILKSNVFYLL